jgi:hypothetical protein
LDFFLYAYSGKPEMHHKKSPTPTEWARIHMLPDKDSNQESSNSESDVLPVTPSGNDRANVVLFIFQTRNNYVEV